MIVLFKLSVVISNPRDIGNSKGIKGSSEAVNPSFREKLIPIPIPKDTQGIKVMFSFAINSGTWALNEADIMILEADSVSFPPYPDALNEYFWYSAAKSAPKNGLKNKSKEAPRAKPKFE